MTKTKRGLGRGLGAYFGEEVVRETAEEKTSSSAINGEEMKEKVSPDMKEDETGNKITIVKISRIQPNSNQPRKEFKEEQMQELAESIKQYGILQPLLVQKNGDFYEIIAGERRWRAAKLAGMEEIPVVIREYNKQQSVEIALIENIQREDLNPIEEAMVYQQLIQEFNLKQEEIAEKVSKNRTTITNSLRLLKLDTEVQHMLAEGLISSGHARTLLSIEQPEKQLELAKKIVEKNLSVRDVEREVKLLEKKPKEKKNKEQDEALELIFQELENRMKSAMGTKVNINRKDKSKGRIEIEYYSEEELERIVELIESSSK